MVYTEIKERNGRRYYYRVISIRKDKKINKKRTYLGVNLEKEDLIHKETKADEKMLSYKSDKRIQSIKSKIIPILKRNKIKKAGIFGSYARGEAKKSSDIDLLIEPPKGMGFGFAGLELQLTKALKKKVELVSYNGISPYLKDSILKEEVKIL